MDFNDIIGQDIMVESLKNAVKNDTVANGYIFSGTKGCGKKLVAGVFAMALNCSAEPTKRPCGICSSCIRTKSGNHPNVDVVRPTGATIKIKQIRDIISDVAKKPFENGYKTVIIEEADKLTQDAQDAFLKTLEEPPQHTVFMLLTENHNRILPTIVSRCQVFQFRPLDAKEIEKYLQVKQNWPGADISAAARYSGGTIGRALALLEDKNFESIRDSYVNILDKTLGGRFSDALGLASETVDTREAAEAFLNFCLEWFRDLVIFRETKGISRLLINADKTDYMTRHNSVLTEGAINSIMEIIKNTIKHIRYNVGIKSSIDGMLLNIAEVSLYNGKNSRSKV